ncbi:CIC11C00000002490 [Sungouiella intermedia]|uniref:CIC11C00000002490 n=1 Tax=Sungouiella intermedia TaxID=45354 RepID=A0A1L0DAV3_9ASCO|nr:CIC11C00000002490 [[Candida] intermedia]
MSATSNSKLAGVLEWLENNSFWNSELLEVRESPIGGVGVFWKLGPDADEENDNLLLRIPKSAVLSPKNSFIYPLLMDYECEEPTVDLTYGMHAIVITFIYEYSMGKLSPWFQYLDSFDIESDESAVPFCLWNKEDNACLYNSEVDLLNMLDLAELIVFMMECARFAHMNAQYVNIPDVLKLDPEAELEDIQIKYEDKLLQFGRCVQAVISRAFTVDKYLGLSLVPGADLFNHLSPIITDDALEERENVHFECDDDDELCEECGEIGCAHLDNEDEDDAELEELDEIEEDEVVEEIEEIEEGEEGEGESEVEVEEEGEGGEANVTLDFLMESDVELDASSESLDSDDEEDDSSSVTESIEDEEVEKKEEKTTITMEDIEELEMSGAETEHDDEEVSTLSLSEDEGENEEEGGESEEEEEGEEDEQEHGDGANADLVQELSNSSKCCDIILTRPPSKEYNYELFNTYGNNLANAYLLQRYGFVSPNNPNTTCLLSVQMFSYLKKEKLNKKKRVQLDTKLEWYEEVGFDVVNELVLSALSADHDHEHDHDHDHEGENENCDDKCDDECGDGCDDGCGDGCGDGDEEIETPESWQLSPRISYDGTPTEQTIALVRLLLMPFKVFFYKLAVASSDRKLIRRVSHYLLEGDVTNEEKKILSGWVKGRLARYKESNATGERARLARELVKEEKGVLHRALEVLET